MKTIYLLIGAKGSGKSFIGSLIEDNFKIPFLRVENWVKQIKNDRDITNELYRVEAFAVIENGVREILAKTDRVAFESVGLTNQFDTMCENLKNDFRIITIGINADFDLCMRRVKSRDQTIHIPIPKEKIEMINSEFKTRNRQTDFTIDNNSKSADDLIKDLKKIINNN